MHAIPGSHREAVGTAIGQVDPTTVVEATLVLRRPGQAPPADAPALSREEFAQTYAAAPADIEAVTDTLAPLGVTVVSHNAAARTVRVRGTAAAIGEAFGVQLQTTELPDGRRQERMRSGEIYVPQALADIVVAVLGLDDREQARHMSQVATADAVATSFTPLQLASIYSMPEADGAGETIAIIELGGGFAQSDLDHYFGGLKLTTPKVTAVGVDGGTNVAGQAPNGADGEVLLDIEVSGAIAPGADILVYFAPNTDAGFLDAITTAAQAEPTPTAMSISWGQSEDQWTAQARTAMDDAIADAVALGVTVTVAAGDNGSGDNDTTGGSVHVDFPASSPHALACGGTSLKADGTTVVSETVWNDGTSGGATGGGVSDVFPLPSWQADVGVPERSGTTTSGRGVPDVAGDADPQTGYQVYVDGQAMVIGGTSAVAPLWAGLVARIAQLTGKRLGLLQPTLYSGVVAGTAAKAVRDITTGNNGAYAAGPGWDACTGLGVPDAATATAFGGTA
ncbi:kumamolisin [Rudaeicoccus suwonensis]|uniref:Kumamolisin n=2 Tax=Rudaeicoccus suwonensis TaxID=657409 RepID=A0A561EAU9_9MICO|nr:kumamolisin [Rudaeicoccus suwonensis]